MQFVNEALESQDESQEMITAIDEDGRLYPIEKMDAHVKNVPHLAISVFIFHDGKLLIQQRASHKYHSGNLWANTCCSHPRWQESPDICASRRITEELGFSANIKFFGKIDYAADVGRSLFENESAYCYVGTMPDNTSINNFNKDEVKALRWIGLDRLRDEVKSKPQSYTQWIRIYVLKHFELLSEAAMKHDDGLITTSSRCY